MTNERNSIMSKTPKWALEEIKKAKRRRLKKLDLNGVWGGGVSEKLTQIPAEVFELEQLEVLDLINNSLTSIPDSITRLQNLTELYLGFNQLTVLPDSISQLQNLTVLNLGYNQLGTVPDSIIRLQNLTSLCLLGNGLTTVSDSISRLQNLTSLYLDANSLATVPDSISRLQNLTLLYLSSNRLTTVPGSISRLQNLKRLDLRGNPIETPPPEVVGGYDKILQIKEIEKIKNYFRQLEKEGKDYLYEAKLLIVGEAGAGKTSLQRKIKNPDCKLPTEDETTRGIEVVQLEFPLPEDVPNVQQLSSKDKKFRVNIWDFGGQEIYHATHQFFLTKRSLYALVADDRKEDTDFDYWLNVVELLSDNSPLLIIKNEKQDRHREINERQLRGQFTNIKETLATNLSTNRGLPEVLKEIKHYVSTLPHIGTALPKTWVKVRETLENDPRNYITLDEYLKICEQNGFSQPKDKLQLSGYLHDLGVCLHFQEDPLLRRTVFLKPSWGTSAVYKVLDNETVIRNLGRFNRDDLAKIWHEDKYANMQDELLQLMINFKLCYQIPNTNDYIAPQLLTKNQPDYKWDETNNLIMRYTYEFMPKGIITQFIVAMHPYIADQKCVWRSGVVLTKDLTKAEVVEDYGKREIKIRVAGKHKKEWMTIVMYELDRIHANYHRLKYNKLIPCNCATCKDSQEPHFFPFQTLQKFMEDRQDNIQCQKSYQMVDVWSLIDDVIDKKQLLEEREKKGIVDEEGSGKMLFELLKRGIEIMREGMKQEKVINIGEGATISAPIVIADTIEKSFNTLAKSEIDDKVKTLLDQLLKAVNEINKKVSGDKSAEAETMARDVEALVKEATSSKPRRKWYEVTLDGLKQTATTIGEIAGPVLDIVNKLRPLLLS